MAREPQESPEERVRKSVARTLANVTVLLASLGVHGAWAYFGIYQIEPGQAAEGHAHGAAGVAASTSTPCRSRACGGICRRRSRTTRS